MDVINIRADRKTNLVPVTAGGGAASKSIDTLKDDLNDLTMDSAQRMFERNLKLMSDKQDSVSIDNQSPIPHAQDSPSNENRFKLTIENLKTLNKQPSQSANDLSNL